MKKKSNFFFFAVVFFAYLLCVPSISTANHTFLGATNKIFFNKDKRISSHLSKKQSVTRLADLPALAREKISQHMQKAEFEVSRFERTLPSGKTSTFQAFNRNQNMSAYFTDQGVHVLPNGQMEPAWHLEMILSGYGYDGAMEPVQPVQPGSIKASGHRIEYRRGVLTEWYVNSNQGLEHGVTLREPPAG